MWLFVASGSSRSQTSLRGKFSGFQIARFDAEGNVGLGLGLGCDRRCTCKTLHEPSHLQYNSSQLGQLAAIIHQRSWSTREPLPPDFEIMRSARASLPNSLPCCLQAAATDKDPDFVMVPQGNAATKHLDYGIPLKYFLTPNNTN